MARITNKQGLISYIKTKLGSPMIKVDVTDTQIEIIIDDAVQKFTEYAYGTLEATVILEVQGKGDYKLPNQITNILQVSKGGSGSMMNFNANFGDGYVPNIWSEQFFSGSFTGDLMPTLVSISTTRALLDKFFGNDVVCNFNPYRKVLQLMDNYTGKLFVHYQYEYIPEQEDMIYNHEWIKDFCVAQTRYQWGNNTGKIDQTLVGGGKINYSDMKSEAMSEIERLNSELLSRWSDVCPILVG